MLVVNLLELIAGSGGVVFASPGYSMHCFVIFHFLWSSGSHGEKLYQEA